MVGGGRTLSALGGSAPGRQGNLLLLVAVLAGEVCCAIDIARSLVHGLLGVGAQRARRLDAFG
jgi:hypothetical protein